MIQLTISFPNAALAILALQALNTAGIDTGVATTVAATGSGGTGNAGKAGKPPAAPAPGPAAPAPAASSGKPAGEAATSDSATLDYLKDVRPLILKMGGAAGGREKLQTLMESFGVTKGPELKPEQLPAAKKALEEALAG